MALDDQVPVETCQQNKPPPALPDSPLLYSRSMAGRPCSASVRRSCPICRGDALAGILHFTAVPVHQNLLARTAAEALGCQRGEIALVQCLHCGFVFNAAFDEQRVLYAARYDADQTHSAEFRRYLDGLAEDLVERHRLREKRIVEIGCGGGSFLARLCRAGANSGLGLDPSQPGGQILPTLTIVPERYGPAHGDLKADLICARHVIEHLPRPAELLDLLRSAIGKRRDVLVCFETPRLEWILDRLAFWDVFYEHCSYFTMGVFRYLFERCGFVVTLARSAFQQQYQWLEARPGAAGARDHRPDPTLIAALHGRLQTFARQAADHRAAWAARVAALAEAGGCAVWGAGAKGVSFLNALGPAADLIPAVVDVNPRKQGCHVPGTGQLIVPPGGLRAYPVRHVLVMNPNYADEVRALLREEDLDLDVISV
jgi:SAM-dependent methyltransferase